MSITHEEKDISYKECRFATYVGSPDGQDDMHYVKEMVHLNDGRSYSNLKPIPNFKRPFWITKEGFRNHEQKKEWEDLSKLNRFNSRQFQLVNGIARALGTPWFNGSLKKVCRSPYVYGADITSTALLKQMYNKKYQGKITPYTVAVFDTETDVVRGTEEVIMASVTMRGKAFTAIIEKVVEGRTDVVNKLQAMKEKYLGEILKDRPVDWEVVIVKDEAEAVVKCFEYAHKVKPDFLAIWNIKFDIQKVIAALVKAGINPADVFSDPSVPKQYRTFDFILGPDKKVTASGLVTPIKPSAQWHTVIAPASFYVICAMSSYRHVRAGGAEEPSYALDAILNSVFADKPEIRKLKFKEADGYSGLEWHQFMQEQYPLEYAVYNLFDCVSVEMLDEKTTDLRIALPMFSGAADFGLFNSQPKRLATALHEYVQDKHEKVMGTTSDEMLTELDELTPSLGGWITALAPHNLIENGLEIIEEIPGLKSTAHSHTADLDVSGSYPNGQAVMNSSKETTKRELCGFVGISDEIRRQQGLNLSGGPTNSAEFCQELYSLPSFDVLLDDFLQYVSGIPDESVLELPY